MNSLWLDLLAWMQALDARLPVDRPEDMLPEGDPQFWWQVAGIEFQTRGAVNAKIEALLATMEPIAMMPWEAFLIRKRMEWAAQVALAKAKEGVEPDATLLEVLRWTLLTTWESDGCIALWNNAERGGKPHPDTPPDELLE